MCDALQRMPGMLLPCESYKPGSGEQCRSSHAESTVPSSSASSRCRLPWLTTELLVDSPVLLEMDDADAEPGHDESPGPLGLLRELVFAMFFVNEEGIVVS